MKTAEMRSKDKFDQFDDDKQRNEAKKVIKRLLKSVEESEAETKNPYSCKPLLNLFKPTEKSEAIFPDIQPKQQQSLILKTIQNFPKGAAKRFLSGLKGTLERIISEEAYVPESAFQNDEANIENEVDSTEIVADERSTECLHFMMYAAMCVEAFLHGRVISLQAKIKERRLSAGVQLQILPQAYEVAQYLHNVLLSLHSCGPESVGTQNSIISLCESWWLANVAYRDSLIAQCLPLLAVRALDSKEFQKSQIKRLFKLKEAFHVIDFTNPSSDSLRGLILRIASNPLCLKMDEGRKFLASIFQDEDLVSDLHLVFRAQIPNATKTILKAYGDIYHRAWKTSVETSDVVRNAIEHQALQDLMHAAIHIASPTTSKSIHTTLGVIHDERKSPDIARLLFRLYSPILWRSLGAANPLVRRNAVKILGKVFPLQDPDENHLKDSVAKATTALSKALVDADPRVRTSASEATAQICARYWDILPAADIRILLNHIVLEHSSDTSSSVVRAASLEATITLLEAPKSHAVLRALLPSLGNLIHDKAERVRLATVKLLLRIKKIQGIRFYHVVPVDHLTARLSEEQRIHGSPSNSVSKELTLLLLNSFFPQGPNVAAGTQLQRALTFLMSDPEAALCFYANIASHLEIEPTIKFLGMLLMCLKSAVETDQAKKLKSIQERKKRRRNSTEETTKVDRAKDGQLSASNLSLMGNLAQCIGAIWESIETTLSYPTNESAKLLLFHRFTEVGLVNILGYFERTAADIEGDSSDERNRKRDCHRVCAALLRCSKSLSPDHVDGMLLFLSSSLEILSAESPDFPEHLSSYLALLCAWGKIEEIALALASSIEAALGEDINIMSPCFDEFSGRRRSRRASSKRQQNANYEMIIPKFSAQNIWAILDRMLRGDDPSSRCLRTYILSSETASRHIESALERGTHFAERLLLADSNIGAPFQHSEVEFILCCCEAYGRFALHMDSFRNGDKGFNRQARVLLDWTNEKVVPALIGARSGETNLRDLDLSRISNVSDSMTVHSSLSPGSPRRQKQRLSRTPERRQSRDSSFHEPAVFIVSSVARSLLQSSCLFFSELLAVGGSCSEEVEECAVQWCRIFDSEKEEYSRQEIKPKIDMLPSFLRLACELCKSTSSFKLLQELFVKCEELEINGGNALVKRTVCSLLQGNSKEATKLTDNVMDAFFGAMDEMQSFPKMIDLPVEGISHPEDIWGDKNTCFRAVFEAINTKRHAKLAFARKLVHRLAIERGDSEKAHFEVRCLAFLINKGDNSSVLGRILTSLEDDQQGGVVNCDVRRLLELAA